MRRPIALLLLCAATALLAFAQGPPRSAKGVGAGVSVPFVGCASFGQTGIVEAPRGTSRPIQLRVADAQALAYYQSSNGIGLLAPRGWTCQGVSGSSGAALLLSPKTIERDDSGWKGLDGPAIDLYHVTHDFSGRYTIFEVMARVFPAYREYASTFWGDDTPLPMGPYPGDTLTYRSRRIVEYYTPAYTEGLGNAHSLLGKTELPIRGAAIVQPRPDIPGHYDVVLLSVRVTPQLNGLVPIIIRQFVRDTAWVRP